MAAPIINIFESDDATDAAAWDAGTIKAGMTSDARKSADPKKDIKEIHVWNNYKQTTAGSNMIECTVTTLAADGTDKMTSKTGATPVDYEHIQYVLDCIHENTTDIRNIKAYMLTTLYNAPMTIDHYYQTKVNHDLYGWKE